MAQEANSKPYAKFQYYEDKYGGSAIDEDSFDRYAKWASYLVDQITFGRAVYMDSIPDRVKDAVCAAAESYYKYQQDSAREAKQESNDGYSITYADIGTEQQAEAKAIAAARIYLSGSGLTRRAVRISRRSHR